MQVPQFTCHIQRLLNGIVCKSVEFRELPGGTFSYPESSNVPPPAEICRICIFNSKIIPLLELYCAIHRATEILHGEKTSEFKNGKTYLKFQQNRAIPLGC